ncbi:DNA/RNA nuclease SfsA [Flavonifractor sp. An100]|uniref:DNA/RNA nuclease SfsA n=1 Tax=Flavonifractor sp. An100 TaxID=1965538 RepID=UPI000B37D400|nr:DNA/RNA nuclease SfsA [Flavonifractor sp. An100]OUQ77072.1 sugar fermentation stimulation protein SfsA [Flavonifractor sp. An100]
MRYPNITPGVFVARPNRFIAHVEVEGAVQVCHVKNTGRCRELLVPGCRVYLTKSDNPARKTLYDLVAVEKETEEGPLLINMDSQAPNRVFGEWAAAGGFRRALSLLRPETTYGNSRFDYYWEQSEKEPIRGFVEVKGVTLEEKGIVRFPDAPTLRGVKHLEELVVAHEAGYETALCFIVQMEGMRYLEPNDLTHPEFGAAVRRAARAGVEVLAMECRVTPDSLTVARPIPVKL